MRISKKISKKKRLILEELNIVKKFTQFYKKLDAEQKRVLGLYKGNGYKLINKYLLNKNSIKDFTYNDFITPYYMETILKTNYINMANAITIRPEKIQKHIEHIINKQIIRPINIIDSLFQNKYVDKLVGTEKLYRGLAKCFVADLKIGDEIVFSNYSSTSYDWDVAQQFAQLQDADVRNSCICVLTGLKGVPYIYLPWIIYHNQNEPIVDIMQGRVDKTEFEFFLPRNLKFKLVGKDENLLSQLQISTYKDLTNLLKKEGVDKISNLLHLNKTRLNKSNKSNKSNKNNKLSNRKSAKKISISSKLFKKMPIYYLEYVETLPYSNIMPWTMPSDFNLKIKPSIDKKAI